MGTWLLPMGWELRGCLHKHLLVAQTGEYRWPKGKCMTAHLENSTITSCNGYLQVSGLACMLFLCMFGWRQFKQVNPFSVRAHQPTTKKILRFRKELPFSIAKIQFSSSQSIKKLNIDPVQAFLQHKARGGASPTRKTPGLSSQTSPSQHRKLQDPSARLASNEGR